MSGDPNELTYLTNVTIDDCIVSMYQISDSLLLNFIMVAIIFEYSLCKIKTMTKLPVIFLQLAMAAVVSL